ncbi:MAG: hypothetical protein PHW12_08045 [Smithella sp.]|nr:hypothetical protein [Smithella sp.]
MKKTLTCFGTLQAAPLNVFSYTPRGAACSVHLNIFEQPSNKKFFNNHLVSLQAISQPLFLSFSRRRESSIFLHAQRRSPTTSPLQNNTRQEY